MAKHLDLEEQEQLDQVKHLWQRYGNAITWVLILVLAGFAGWNGWQYWQRNQAAKAAALYDEVDRAAKAGDAARLERAFGDIRDGYGGTTYAQQAGLLAGKVLYEKGNADAAKAALTWVADKSSDPGYQAMARLRLAGVLFDAKAYDQALQQLGGSFAGEFAALAADRRGDILAAQDKKAEALAEYRKAYAGLDARMEYRRMVEVKLNALGVDPNAAGATK
ncbi:YfgM family protein [Pseudorhodoferax sp.]|uniref:YfgM family protein n=1 Tax=Pseudorhodoferax sp. TaxID=1993553 RepID=UPI002DD696DA|nr:tetratricopeptide repeat protein [Pseudorhodoferax sp.]